MTAKEKSEAIQKYCDTHGCDDTCPLWDKISEDEYCFALDGSLPCDIDRNYSIIFGNDEVDRKNDEIKFVKVAHEEAVNKAVRAQLSLANLTVQSEIKLSEHPSWNTEDGLYIASVEVLKGDAE